MNGDCGRHVPFTPDPTPGATGYPLRPYYTVRCTHLDNRFVVEIANQTTGWRFVDYVEDATDTESMRVECGGYAWEPGDPAIEGAWRAMVARMEAGDPPRPEDSV